MQRRFLRKRGAAGVPAPPGGAVAQRLRGYKWRSEKSVKAIAPTGAALAFCASTSSLGLLRASSPWRRVAAPSIRFAPWAALASCWPLPQQLLPVSAAGGGRSCCVAGWVESRGREGGVGTPLPASGPAERPCTLAQAETFPAERNALFRFSFGVKREHPSACAYNTKKRPALPVEMRGACVYKLYASG